MNSPITVPRLAKFRYKTGLIRNGKRVFLTPWVDNLILDSGLNKVATLDWCKLFEFCLFGDKVAPTEVRRDSGGVTFATSGATCTASGNFFVPADTGRLIKFNDGAGQERYLTYVSATVATLSSAPSPAIAGDSATVWYVNQTALEQSYSATQTYGNTGGDNGNSCVGNLVTNKRTFIGAAVAGPVTLTEIGFNESSSNVNIFDRDVIPGGIFLSTGDQPLCVCELIMLMNPGASVAVPNTGTGFDNSGDAIICGLGLTSGVAPAMSRVNTNGSTGSSGNNSFEAHNAGATQICLSDFIFSLPPFSNGQGPDVGGAVVQPQSSNLLPYSAGNFYRDIEFNWGVSVGNRSNTALVIGPGSQAQWVLKYTTPLVKNSTQTLLVTIRKSWGRALVN